MNVNYLLERLNYTPINAVTVQIDLNEINLGSYLVTMKTYSRLIHKIKMHVLNLSKQIAMYLPKSKVFDIEFTLVLNVYNQITRTTYTVHFGLLHTWKKTMHDWVKKYSEGDNLYAEIIYILAYQKCTVK